MTNDSSNPVLKWTAGVLSGITIATAGFWLTQGLSDWLKARGVNASEDSTDVLCEYGGRLTSRYLDNLISSRASIYAEARKYWDTGLAFDAIEGTDIALSRQEEILVDIGTEVRSPDYFGNMAPEQFYKDKVDRQAKPKLTQDKMPGIGRPSLRAESAADRLIVVEELIASTVKDSLTEDSISERCIDEWNERWEASIRISG
ncbi:MAG: hypothetical protein AAFY91_18355 [Bacteroidota bacterium]